MDAVPPFLDDPEQTSDKRTIRAVGQDWWPLAGLQVAVFLLIVGIWWILGLGLEHDRRSVLAAAEKDAANLARAFEEHVARTLKDMDFLIHILRDEWLESPAELLEKAEKLQIQYKDLVVQFGVIGADGMLEISNLQRLTSAVDLSDREHFLVHRNSSADRLFISRPVAGRVSGKSSLQLTRRLSTPDGSFAGVMVLSIDPRYFEGFYDTIDVGQRGGVVLIGLDRVIRARASRVPTTQSALGREVPADRPFLDPAKPDAGIYRVVSSVDGVQRINAYRRINDYSLAVLVVLAEDEVFAEHLARRESLTRWARVLSVVLVAGGGLLTWLLWMRQRYRMRLEGLNEELRFMATTDPLTGACNRRHFLELANGELERARRYERSLSVLMLDVDHFKHINDTHGHAVGDKALEALVTACRGTLRGSDLLGRLGGEEFAVLLPETDVNAAFEVAERLRAAVSAIVLDTPNGPVGITVSVGVSAVWLTEVFMEKPLIRADQALYRAKAEGRNRVASAAA